MNYFFTSIREATRAVGHQYGAFLGSILTVFLAMLIAGSFALIIKNTNIALEKLRDEAIVEVYLQDNLDSLGREQLRDEIVANEFVLGVKFISKEAALYRLRQTFGPEMVAGLKTNPLPESFEISLDPDVFEKQNFALLVEAVEKFNGVDDIGYVPTVIAKLKTLFNLLSVLGILMGLLVALATGFIVGNTIHVKIADRRQTFYIMRLVGASIGFIRSPYLMIGTLIGLFGSSLAILFVWLAQLYFSGYVVQTEFLTPVELVCFIIAGGLFGFIGSHFALRRFLKI